MNYIQSSFFLVPIGIGSTVLLYLSSNNGDKYSLFTDNGTYDEHIKFLLLLSFVYFFIDFCLMIVRYKPEYKIYFVHHMLGIISIPLIYFRCYEIIKYLLAYLTFELSTPLFNIASYCHKKKIVNIYAKLVNLLFFSIFTIIRVIFGFYLTYKTVPLFYNMDYPLKFLMFFPIALQIMNYNWYRKLVMILIKKKKN